MSSKPKFISFEGTEGVGKTTAITAVCAYLAKESIPFVRTREPGGTPLAEALREVLLDKNSVLDVTTELLALFTARADHIHKVIMPALDEGKWVICDRFIDSTIAYQGFGRYGGKPSVLADIELLISHFVPVLPHHTFWLCMDAKEGLARANSRSSADRFEGQGGQFFEQVAQGFAYQHQNHPKRIIKIDANTDKQTLASLLISQITPWVDEFLAGKAQQIR